MTNRRGRRNSRAAISNNKGVMPSKDFSQMRLRFYIVRPEPNKTCVPMVALDELPAGFRLKGVPLTVTPQQIQEWDMARVGADVELTDSFEVDFDCLALPQRSQQSDPDNKTSSLPGKTELSNKAENETPTTNVTPIVNLEDDCKTTGKSSGSTTSDKSGKSESNGVHPHEKAWRPLSELQQQANDAANEFVEQSNWEKENDRSKTQDAATPGVYGKKKFCTHWIRTGNCDYMQEGCRYLHVIPDAETRLRIGIRDMPRWAKEDLPSPPREIHRVRRHSSSPLKESKKDSQKDWRNRGNRKVHAELPGGPPLTQRPAPRRPVTPTPQTTTHGKHYGPQLGSMQTQMVQPMGNNHADLLAAQLADLTKYDCTGSESVQQNPSTVYHDTAASQPIQPAASAAAAQQASQKATQPAPTHQGSFMRQQQFTPLLSNSTPLPTRSTVSSNLHGLSSLQSHSGYGYGQSSINGNCNAFRSPHSTMATAFGSGDVRFDSGRWGYPSHQLQSVSAHQLMQSRLTSAAGTSMPSPWNTGRLTSPTPSFSEGSAGTIGHGRPTNSGSSPSTPMNGSPILHKRLFRQPGESQYVEAQPEPKVKPKNSDRHRGHKGKGVTTFEAQDGDEGCSGHLGNLIALDE